jgi:cysteinyl-tRNA synthetase
MDKKNILQLYNTQTKEKETIFAKDKEVIRLYTCGPTVYDYAHIGNFRTYIFEDLLKRTLQYFNMKVVHVMNITDVDDKTIKGALVNKVSLDEFTSPYKKAFFEDIKALRIDPADYYPQATDYIEDMINIIVRLLDKGYAYRGNDGSIYFSISKFSDYGKLSHFKLEELKKGASNRCFADEYDKENASDFVLWKSYDEKRDGSIYWDSIFGLGRPGWHLECSAMALKLLGDTVDIHCGGVDNIFPHHENEIAQSESYTGKTFVNHWAHSEYLIVENKKMSKSLGNFYTLRDLLKKGFTPVQVRFLLLQTHYRMNLNFTMKGLESAKHSLDRIHDFIVRLNEIDSKVDFENIDQIINKAKEKFDSSLSDDLNISAALAALFDFIRDVNVLCDQNKIGKDNAESILEFLKKINKVLQIMSFEEEIDIPDDIKEALKIREQARGDKNYQEADNQRDYINKRGYVIEDTKKGARVKKNG